MTDEEGVEESTFFASSVFNTKTGCALGTEHPELENRDREQNGATIIQGEMVSSLLHHLNTNRSMGPDGIHPHVLRKLAEMLPKSR